ncbi:coagulation factor VIII [Dunckerocampus dactyliophorus]|uniref:coagulation factor VIII n=1 Tax=Dunckerocampus dactyliophorus TaxID=161453 RepID=UPI0024049BC1|nr:coagulation factor VIII [Dunckerocampus dactyliophorus]XP_054647874.1 coagulation factor VIII [Dunckerocampus dactyliophorus]
MATSLLTPLLLLCAVVEVHPKTVKEHYIAAVEIGWDYVHVGGGGATPDQRWPSKDAPQKYKKAIYREYTDATYTVPTPRSPQAGIQGPLIVTEPSGRVVVHFRNLASRPYSISPVGITYGKQSEGAGYEDSTGGQEKEDDAVSPGRYHKYVWDINANDGPTDDDPECLTYSYSSQVDPVRDLNSGLIGVLLICKSSALRDGQKRKNTAFILLFAVFDEKKSWYGDVGERRGSRKEYHTVNGYINATLPGLTMCQSNLNVFWHLIGIGTAPEIHSIQFQHHTLKVMNHRKVTLEVTPMTFVTAQMKPTSVGRFLISCLIHSHRLDGMKAMFTVDKCPEPTRPPGPDLRRAKYDEDFDSSDYVFEPILIPPKTPQVRSSSGKPFLTKQHYIAAEEVMWDYAPHLEATDSELQYGDTPTGPHHLDYKYKKVAYVEYTDASFTKRKKTSRTLMGPLLKGKVKDHLHITFKNLASHPFNIYPNGLTKIYPLLTSTEEKDLRSMEVPPNGTFVYVWELTTNDAPLEEDPQCLAQLYQSTVSPERDLASGLVGILLICKFDSMDKLKRLVRADKEWSLMFAVFDENKSWYVDENLYKDQNSSKSTDPEFYDSNVIYSINGLMFSGHQLVVCQTDITFWHMASVGIQNDFLSVYFTGNLFQYHGLHQAVLTLFPMTAITISMEMDLPGEWDISAFDSSLKKRGMSFRYSVCPCDGDFLNPDDIADCGDQTYLIPKGKKLQSDPQQMINVTKVSSEGRNEAPAKKEEEGIPLDILEELERNGDWIVAVKDTELERSGRRRRQAEGNWTSSREAEDGESKEELGGESVENGTDATVEPRNESPLEMNVTMEESNEILLQRNPGFPENISSNSLEMDQESESGSGQQGVNLLMDYNYTAIKNTGISLSVDYDDYNQEEKSMSAGIASDKLDMRSGKTIHRYYYIAAEEISWDYGIKKPRHLIKPREMQRGMRKFLPEYKKVVFKAYSNRDFLHPAKRGELHQHLGLMGPVIKVEVNDVLTVIFKNKASRPYSFHLQGVYDRTQGGGLVPSHSTSLPFGVPGEPVQPGEARLYNWKIARQHGPTKAEFDCKAGAYYSTINKEKDLHSGLIGPLVVCKRGTLQVDDQPKIQDFSLLFHTFDETKSWYLEENLRRHCAPPCQVNPEDPWYHISNKFSAINGYVAETLPGLLVPHNQTVRWYLLNVGGDGEYHAVHFHGLPFTVHIEQNHRMGVYNLFPGVFGTVEMIPSTIGTWLVECTIGDYQLAGMRAKLLVYDPECALPLGMQSQRIKDSQITASDHIGSWKPQLARLHQSGYINAWMGSSNSSWLQVDLLKPTLLHGIETQGVSSNLRNHYISLFTVSYSLDQEKWTTYQGNLTNQPHKFHGNMHSSNVKRNQFRPPLMARYIRIHPENSEPKPALRLELLGCDVNSCSHPLGLRSGQITTITASSYRSSLLRSWKPTLARLHQQGSVNAWRPKSNSPQEWLQVDLGTVKRITGVVTQGATSLFTEMMVTEFAVSVSDNETLWRSVLEEDSQSEKIFTGNSEPDEEALTVFEPAVFGRYLRIYPRGWVNDIALRLEVLGCDMEKVP